MTLSTHKTHPKATKCVALLCSEGRHCVGGYRENCNHRPPSSFSFFLSLYCSLSRSLMPPLIHTPFSRSVCLTILHPPLSLLHSSLAISVSVSHTQTHTHTHMPSLSKPTHKHTVVARVLGSPPATYTEGTHTYSHFIYVST